MLWSHPPRIVASYDKKGVFRRLLDPQFFWAALIAHINQNMKLTSRMTMKTSLNGVILDTCSYVLHQIHVYINASCRILKLFEEGFRTEHVYILTQRYTNSDEIITHNARKDLGQSISNLSRTDLHVREFYSYISLEKLLFSRLVRSREFRATT